MAKSTIKAEAEKASVENPLNVERFLLSNYQFRFNELSGKVEFSNVPEGDEKLVFKPLTESAFNSIVIRAKREEFDGKRSPRTDIREYVYSDEVPRYNPIQDYLEYLPKWDGKNHVADVLNRIPGLCTELQNFLTIWLRSAVAHWMQMDTLHGNECVPTLIGEQGIGKTVFIRRLLPIHLRGYFLERLRMTNDFSKDMALTNNLLVNLDELESIKPSQQAELKHILSMNRVNGRRIFASTQDDMPRFASFVATTNERHPLKDPTGSRRFICVNIPEGKQIDNSGEIDHDQLYAQVMYELQELKSPYWFNDKEVARLQQLNKEFMEKKNLDEMLEACFRKPEPEERYQAMNSTMLLDVLLKQFSNLKKEHGTKVSIGNTMRDLGFDSTPRGHVSFYKVVPLRA